MERQRIIYLDILKILAIILVIFNHSHWSIANEGTFWNFMQHFLYGVCKCAVPIFIMATGAVILKRETNYKEILKASLRG